MAILFLLVIAAVPVVVTFVAIVHPSHHFLWGHRIVRMALGSNGPYRNHRQIDVAEMKEPRSVRATSILTALLGGMIVPGGLAAIVGIIVLVVMLAEGLPLHKAEDWTVFLVALSAPSGVIISVRCLRLYGPMLENQLGVTARMRSLAYHSGIHNALLLLVYAAYGLSDGAHIEQLAWATYPLVSLFHAGMLMASARTIERCRAENDLTDRALDEPAGAWSRLPTADPHAEGAAPSLLPAPAHRA